ncbi:MAG: hypothetical protein IKI61_04195 [Erysipelotrichaceae bacterium]|nr:hypothetical protein [Erysipelotrichaceae bacterium]
MALDLNFKKKEKIVLPKKKTINFISDRTEKNNRTAVILFVIFMLCLAVFVKFAVIDPLNKVAQAERLYNEMERQLDGYRKELANYNEVQDQYNEMVGSFLTETELSYQDRIDILNMVERDIRDYVEIQSITMSNNTVRVLTGQTTMDTVSHIVDVLESDSRNSYVTVTTTQTDNSDRTDYVYANLIINYSGAGE